MSDYTQGGSSIIQPTPLRYVAHFNQGTLLRQLGQTALAAHAFAEATRAAPQFLPAYLSAGAAFESLGHLAEAISYWIQAADQLVPTDGEGIGHKNSALRHLARVCKHVGNMPYAEEALRRCLDINPNQRDVIQHWIAARERQCKWPVIQSWGK